jgi:hypothetical protein
VIGGTPTAVGTSPVTSSFTVQVTGGGTASKALSITVNPETPSTVTLTVMPLDGSTDVPVNTVVTATVSGSSDIRSIFNKDTFTLKPDVTVEDSSTGPAGPLAAGVCVKGGVVQGSIEYDGTNTEATFTPNCTLQNGTTYVASIASTAAGLDSSTDSWRFTTIAGSPDSDGDGVPDNEDAFPFNKKKSTPPSPKGHGPIEVDAGDSAGTSLAEVMGISDTNSRLNQSGRPAELEFLDGLVSFKVEGVAPGGTIAVKVTFPSDIPAGSKVYQVDANGFHEYAGATISGNSLTMTLTDGGPGDGDGQVNGTIVDPVGVASPATTGSGSLDLSTSGASGGCSIAGKAGSGGGLRDMAESYGFLLLAALGIALRGIVKKREA